jgi:hypothetical protein
VLCVVQGLYGLALTVVRRRKVPRPLALPLPCDEGRRMLSLALVWVRCGVCCLAGACGVSRGTDEVS